MSPILGLALEIPPVLRHNAAMPDPIPVDSNEPQEIPQAELVTADPGPSSSAVPATVPTTGRFENFVESWAAETTAATNPPILPPIRTSSAPAARKSKQTLAEIFDAFFADEATAVLDSPEPTAAPEPAPEATKTYVVPSRFGIGAILGLTTALAILFALFRGLGVDPFAYVYFGLLSLVICLVQMRFGDVPRVASSAAGAILSIPLGIALLISWGQFSQDLCAAVGLITIAVPIGALFGYVTGTAMAGIFLALDLFGKQPKAADDTPPLAGPLPEETSAP